MQEKLRELIKNSRSMVFFGGAGVSTESGIPDFRSENGLWHTQTKYGCSPEEVVSHSFFIRFPEQFYEFYWERMVFSNIEPNITHRVLARLERAGRLQAVVTQNIDGLHQRAGSRVVHELHGSILRYTCMRCGQKYALDYAASPANRKTGSFVPRCRCAGMLKPDVTLFGEALDSQVTQNAVRAIRAADLLIVGGTSLVVYPAAGLLDYFRGSHLVLINRQKTPFDARAEIVVCDCLGKVFGAIGEI